MTEVLYAPADGTHVANRVMGDPGGIDVVMVAGAFFPFEMLEEDRVASAFHGGAVVARPPRGVRQTRGRSVGSDDRLGAQRTGAVGR